ncbi:MAG: hypothetical protein ACLU5H_05940 [Alphaproteobacteria bacterium]
MEKNVKPSDTLRKERRPFFCACGAILFSADSFFGIKNFRSCGAEIRHLRLRRKSILFLKRAPQAGLR